MNNKKILITGVSSGIGQALAKSLIKQRNHVWGVARRKKLLEELSSQSEKKFFTYSVADLTFAKETKRLIIQLKRANYKPDVIIFNAAILKGNIRQIFAINFFSPLFFVESILPYVDEGAIFVAISSSSSLKGSKREDIGYGASKAALSIAFESLYLKYKEKNIQFKIVFFGPVGWSKIGISYEKAVNAIEQAINCSKTMYYHPKMLFFALKFSKLLPQRYYFTLLDMIDKYRVKLSN